MRTIVVALFACTALLAQQSAFFVQMSDPQMGMFSKDADFVHEQANLSFVVANINRLKPAFVVVCGDLVNRARDSAQISAYQQIINNVDSSTAVYNVPGNHDVGNQPTPTLLAGYRRAFGKDYYSFDAGAVRGIVLNSSLIAAPGSAPDEAAAQEKWLLEQLKKARQDRVEHIYIFQHHPFFLKSAEEPDQYFNIPTASRRRYLGWFHDYGVTHIFAGHYHRNDFGRDGTLEMITTGPVGMPLGNDQSGIRIVRVMGKTTEHRYYELGSIPHAIDPRSPLPQFPAAVNKGQ